MSNPSKNPAALSSLLTDMSDAQWHTTQKITQRNAKNYGDKDDLKNEVLRLVNEGVLIAGANNSYRMPRDYAVEWRKKNNLSLDYKKDNTAPRIFGGILEDDVWESAPLRDVDTVYFRATEDVLDSVKPLVGHRGQVFYDVDGIIRIYCLNADEILQELKALAENNVGLDISGIRITKNTKRREITDLPPKFLNDFCEFYGRMSHIFLRKAMTSVSKYIPEPDDVQQQIYFWVLEAITKYNDKTSTPFAAFLHYSIGRWVYDLSRKSFGRAVADSELQLNRTLEKIRGANEESPSIERIAEILDETPDKIRKRITSVNSANSIKHTISFYQQDGTLNPHLYLTESDDSVIDEIENEVNNTMLSIALTSAIVEGGQRGRYDVESMLSIISKTWGNNNKSITMKENKILEKVREKLK